MRESMSVRLRADCGVRPATAACAALGVLALGAAGCGSSGPAASSSKTVTLTFWNAYNETDAEASTMAKVVIPQFEKENPGIKVNSVVYPYAELLQKYLAASAAGDPPDLLRSDIAWVPELASQGVALKVSGLSWFTPIASASLPGPLADDRVQAAPATHCRWTPTPRPCSGTRPTSLLPASPDRRRPSRRCIADAAKLTNKAKSQYGLGVDGTDIWNVAPYIWSQGGSLTNSAYTSAAGVPERLGDRWRRPAAGEPAQGRRHRHRLPRRHRRGVGRARLPEGPVRHVHRRPVGGANVRRAQARRRTTASRRSRQARPARSPRSVARTS